MSWLIVFEGEPQNRVPRVFRDRLNPLENMSDNECVQRFRFDRNGINEICKLLQIDLIRPTLRSHSLPVVVQVCAALRFFAQGAFYRVTGDTLGISKSSLSIVVHSVARALHRRVKDFIRFPDNEDDLTRTKQSFFAIRSFPNVIGAIDCTHIEILGPKKEIEPDYVNRKGRHSINVQAVANPDLEFTNVVAKFPGRTHDSFIWSNCGLKHRLNGLNQGWLLGDAGYPLEPNLMTPVGNPTTDGQTRYNIAHTKTRNVVERAFGVLKMRFRCLDSTAGKLMFTPERSCKVIIACFILHNIARKHNFYGFDVELNENSLEMRDLESNENNQRGQTIRANLIINNFT